MTEFAETRLPIEYLHEPQLEFGFGQKTAHPKDGLFLYGPHAPSGGAKEIRVGVIGTTAGIIYFRKWSDIIKDRVQVPPPGKGEKADRLHLANFPGFEAAFGVRFESSQAVAYTLDTREIDRATRILNLHEAVAKTVDLYAAKARRHIANDERAIDVWVLVLPEIVFDRCRPGSKRTGLPMEKGDFGKRQKKRSDLPLLDEFIDKEAENVFDDVPDFHRQIKAEFLTIGPTQIIRETTLAPDSIKNKAGYNVRRTQDVATVAWNLATGLYYKTPTPAPMETFRRKTEGLLSGIGF